MSTKYKIESGAQLLARLRKGTNVENFYPKLFEAGLKSGEFVEITYDGCISHLLIDFVTEALIATRKSESPSGILIFNTDGKINYQEVISVLKKKILLYHNSKEEMEINIENVLREVTSNLYIMDICDSNQYSTSIFNLESILDKHPNISTVIFDSLTAFYWSEQGYKITKMNIYLKSLIDTIKRVIKEYKTICIYTKPEYFNNKDTDLVPMEVDYYIQTLDLNKGSYQVNIKTSKKNVTRFYSIIDEQLHWTN